MKLHIRNLGRIEEAEIDWRPLTVFVGETNTNKTWTAYAAYALAQGLQTRVGFRLDEKYFPSRSDSVSSISAKITQEIKQRLSDVSHERDRLQELATHRRAELATYENSDGWQLRLTGAKLARCLALDASQFSETDVRLSVQNDGALTPLWHDMRVFLDTLELGGEGVSLQLNSDERRSTRSVHFPVTDDFFLFEIPSVIESLLLGFFSSVVPFPAERKALTSLYNLLGDQFEELLSRPVVDYVWYLRRARNRHEFARSRNVSSHQAIGPIADSLEQIVGGHVGFGDGAAVLRYFRDGLAPLALHGAASLVRSLAGLFFSADQDTRFRSLLVIDEPEMNAHPRAQCQIIELLAQLVNQGHYVLITTHSPYILDQLNNLVNAGTVPEERREELAQRFTLKTPDAFLDPEKVSVYHFRADGESADAKVVVEDLYDRDENLIDGDTFANISEDLERTFLATVKANLKRE